MATRKENLASRFREIAEANAPLSDDGSNRGGRNLHRLIRTRYTNSVMATRKRKHPQTVASKVADRRALAVAAGLCRECLRDPARPGLLTCAPCVEKAVARRERNAAKPPKPKRKRKREPGTLTVAEVSAARRRAAITAGLCSICTSNRARPTLLTCVACGARAAVYRAKKNARPSS